MLVKLPVLTFGNCVLKPGVIKYPVKLYVHFFNVFFKIQKNMTFYVFLELLHTFSQTLRMTAVHTVTCPHEITKQLAPSGLTYLYF